MKLNWLRRQYSTSSKLQTQKNYEIIIVNSGGTETSNIRKLSMVSIYDTSREGAARARNFGANKASGDVLAFADAHLEFNLGWDCQILQSLEEKSIIPPCITAIEDQNSKDCGFKWKNLIMDIEWFPDIKSHIHEVPFACGCCMAVVKNTFDKIGRFDSGSQIWGVEDAEICLRAWLLGYSVLCEPSIKVRHMFRDRFPYEVQWLYVPDSANLLF
jgi:glycosyltransferase involved in cell wall biosynthesis